MRIRTVSQVLQSKGYEVFSVGPADTVLSALRVMAERNIGALVVLEKDDLVGVITERDCARKLDLMGRSATSSNVGEIMEKNLTTVTSDTSIDACLRLMTDERVRHLPVVDEELVGLISIGDVGKALISDQEHLIEDLTGFITGSPR